MHNAPPTPPVALAQPPLPVAAFSAKLIRRFGEVPFLLLSLFLFSYSLSAAFAPLE